MANFVYCCFSLLLLLLIHCCFPSAEAAAVYNITDFGAKPDGQTDSTKALLDAWAAACGSAEPASTIYVPDGFFTVGQAVFTGPCNTNGVTIECDGTLVAPSDYSVLASAGQWLKFERVEGLSIFGGTIDGRGSSFWANKASNSGCPNGAPSLYVANSNDVLISGLRSVDSQLYHIVIDGCDRVRVQGVMITAPGNSPNTDGIHVEDSTNVTVAEALIQTGDDCISVGPGTSNLWIENVVCGPGHGISIGSLGKRYEERGVENVTVRSTVFTGSMNGLRIKTWGRPSDGFVRGVAFEHALMQNVRNPIIIDQNYCPSNINCPDQNSGVRISQVQYTDIQGSSASQVAVNFNCSASNPCSGIELRDIKLDYDGKPAESSCMHANGTASGTVIPPSCFL
ncbi:Polygalacturonase [Ananas comosus]|uniref:Exopolygalacturonase n=1 Tax=Ananas comosus TaxID=4615 RepID=A0A199V9Y7_ANACO|nr:Polygalacturonase [Ananas comosus]